MQGLLQRSSALGGRATLRGREVQGHAPVLTCMALRTGQGPDALAGQGIGHHCGTACCPHFLYCLLALLQLVGDASATAAGAALGDKGASRVAPNRAAGAAVAQHAGGARGGASAGGAAGRAGRRAGRAEV